ncbi:MAG: cysteine sulfinate desulfinase [Bacillota bacterium]|jgi:cysteine desulfurase/selenocysteine lyase|nr:cysteine sulfinate desulfinase [Bacillota bacterium]
MEMERIRQEFPMLNTRVYGSPIVYLDNAATTQMPYAVLKTMEHYYHHTHSNIHRGVHYLSEQSTCDYEKARNIVKDFMNAESEHEVIFTSGTTDSINIVALAIEPYVNEKHEIIVTEMEHHSNYLPWQALCKRTGAKFIVAPVSVRGELDFEELERLMTQRTALLAICHSSNVTGAVNPVKKVIECAHQKGIPVLVDGAQSVSHQRVDVQNLDCDFYCFSGHKAFGPTGIGVLYGKQQWLNQFMPVKYGGGMVRQIKNGEPAYWESPAKFEAGTPNIAGAIGLGAAIEWFASLPRESIISHELELTQYIRSELLKIPGITLVGSPEEQIGIVSFTHRYAHPFDIASLLDKLAIAVRSGAHCAQPFMDRFGISGTVRVSISLYNTKEEIDYLINGIKRILKVVDGR